MITVTLPTIGTLETGLPDTTHELYQSAALSYELLRILKAMSDAGMTIRQAESSDFTSFNADTLTGIDDFEERLDEILASGVSSVSAALPDVTSIIAALLSGGSGAVIPILLKGVLDTILRHMNSRTTAAQGDFSEGVDSAGIITALEEIKDQMDAVLTEFNINLHDDMEQSSWSVGPVAE